MVMPAGSLRCLHVCNWRNHITHMITRALVHSANRLPATMQQQRPSSLLQQMHPNSSSRSQHQAGPLQRNRSHNKFKRRTLHSSNPASQQPQHSSSSLLQGQQVLEPAQPLQPSRPAQPHQATSAHSSNSSSLCSSSHSSSQDRVRHYRQLQARMLHRRLLCLGCWHLQEPEQQQQQQQRRQQWLQLRLRDRIWTKQQKKQQRR